MHDLNYTGVISRSQDVVMVRRPLPLMGLLFTRQGPAGCFGMVFAKIPRTTAPKYCLTAFCVHREACCRARSEQ